VTNCILWGDTSGDTWTEIAGGTSISVRYSDVQHGWGGTGNINADPCFVDTDNPNPNLWNLRLKPESPCIDVGNNNASRILITDLDGHPRILDGDCDDLDRVDIGACEFNYAYLGDFDYNCTVNLIDFAFISAAWMTIPNDPNWNYICDISPPANQCIDLLDLCLFYQNWLIDMK